MTEKQEYRTHRKLRPMRGRPPKPVKVLAEWAAHDGVCSACQNPCVAGVKVMCDDPAFQGYVLYCKACSIAIVTALYQHLNAGAAQ